MESKRRRIDQAGGSRSACDGAELGLSGVLQRLAVLLAPAADGSEGEGQAAAQEAVLEQLLSLEDGPMGQLARQAVQEARLELEGALEALQAVVDAHTPPEGYRPPRAGDAAYARSIVSYAHKLAYTTAAPPGFVPGVTQLRHFKPPAPQDTQLRASLLHQFQRDYEARQQQQQQAAPAQQQQQAQAAQAGAAAAAGPAAALSREGLLAKMPPGWKPGDAIPPELLAAAAALAAPAPAAGAPAAAEAAAAPPAAAEAPAALAASAAVEQPARAPAPPRPVSGAFNFALNQPVALEEWESASEDDADEESSSGDEDSD